MAEVGRHYNIVVDSHAGQTEQKPYDKVSDSGLARVQTCGRLRCSPNIMKALGF